MYELTLALHNVTRWLVVLTGIAAIAMNISGLTMSRAWEPKHRKINAAFIGSLHLQVVLGLLLYAGNVSPTMRGIFSDFGGAMRDAGLRFWAVEHITLMLLAALIAHIAHILSKRQEDTAKRFQYATIGFVIAGLLIVAAIPWPFRALVGRSLLPSL